MGEVWAAHDPDLDRRVALKVLRRELASNDGARARLQREGRAMARLRHPNVITVHEAVFSDGRGVIAMELVDGTSLAGWLATRREPRAVVAAVVAAGRGLAAAHTAGMVHRDFKPHNVLVDRDGRVVVTDFGLARATEMMDEAPTATPAPAIVGGDDPTVTPTVVGGEDHTVTPASESVACGDDPTAAPASAVSGDDPTAAPELAPTAATPSGAHTPTRPSAGELDSPLTMTGELLGTPAYMAPEQLTGGDVDARSDQFAFCVTAWEALAGRRPFTGVTFAELRAAVLDGAPTGGDAIPARLRPILTRGLARSPDDRWPDMPSLLRAIERAWRRPRRIAIAAGAVAVIASLAAGAVMLRGGAAPSPCAPADQALASVWSPAIRARIAQRLGTDAQAASVLGFFDRWRDRWTTADRAVCTKPAAPDFAARRACLDSLRDEVAIWRGAMDGLPERELRYLDYSLYVAAPEICQVNPRAIAPTLAAGADPTAAIALRTEMITASFKANSDHERVDFAPYVERARALGSGVLVAEALLREAEAQSLFATDYAAQGEACATSALAAAEAERAGHDRYRVLALIQQLQCDILVEAPMTEQLEQARRLQSAVDRLGDPALADVAAGQLWQVDAATGQWTKAIDRLDRARQSAIARGSSASMIYSTVHAAEVRRQRHLDGDHATAIDQLRRLVPVVHTPNGHAQRMIADQLAPLLWMTGEVAGAVAYFKVHSARASPAVEVRLRVAGDGAAGAEVIAAIDPNLDPVRLSMGEYDGPVPSGTTDADGALTLQAPIGGVIVARAGSAIAVVPVPDRGGRVAIALAPGQALHGTVTGFAAVAEDDPALLARAARREIPTIFATTFVGGRALTWHAPIAVADGSWSLPPLPPGRYVIAADVSSALGDDQTAQAVVDVGADAPVPAITLALPPPGIARVIVHPAIAGRVAILPAGTVPSTWAEATARFAAATTLSMANIGEALPQERLVPGAAAGDAYADVSVLTPRPAVACVLPALHSTFQRSLWRSIPGPDKTPPMCRELPAGDEPVVIETR